MNSIVSTATEGGNPLLVFALSAAGLIVAALVTVLIWLVKDRIKSRRTYEDERTRARERYEDKLEKRLSAGSDVMKELKEDNKTIRELFLTHLAEVFKKSEFREFSKEHDTEHEKINRQIEEMKEVNYNIQKDIATIRTSIEAQSKILQSIVRVNDFDLGGKK